jgi:hypothetical protein
VCRVERKNSAKNRWVRDNPEKRRLAKQRWSKANREKMRKYHRCYYEANPSKIADARQRQRAQEIAASEVLEKLIGVKVRIRDGYVAKRILQQLGET